MTRSERPIPRVLIASHDALRVADLDAGEETRVSARGAQPVAFSYHAHAARLYWIDAQRALMTSHVDGSEPKELLKLRGDGQSIAVDWVARKIYWTELNTEGGGSLYMYDLNLESHQGELLDTTVYRLESIVVEPRTSALVMLRSHEGHYHVMRRQGDDGATAFFSASSEAWRRRRSVCNCSQIVTGQVALASISVQGSVAIDETGPDALLFWADDKNVIWATSMDACTCRLVFNGSDAQSAGLPLTSLTVDTGRVYWSNAGQGALYSVDKRTGGTLQREQVDGVKNVKAFGKHIQPYPAPHCLTPPRPRIEPRLHNVTNTTINLSIQQSAPPPDCAGVSMATVRYTVYMTRRVEEPERGCAADGSCETWVTTSLRSAPLNLDRTTAPQHTPESTVPGCASNAQQQRGRPDLSPPVPHSTLTSVTAPRDPVPGRPPRRRAHTVPTTVTPERVNVSFRIPEKLRGPPDGIRYTVAWRRPMHPTRKHKAVSELDQSEPGTYSVNVDGLEPGSKFLFKVVAYARDAEKVESAEVGGATYATPGNVTLLEAGTHSLTIQWTSPDSGEILRHAVRHRNAGEIDWRTLPYKPTQRRTVYNETVGSLWPKTEVVVHLRAVYASGEVYEWPDDDRFSFETIGTLEGES
ncbi:PREDICTED: protein sevenless-like [Priapulus caudatus]|uniref:Protein sevenless-like n=1 Tax=Priapulus caudatus TaxID=37621 RepID=A0ABM1ES92_PRICU|nr:PREDICTED: protein sevenless-like [Priapulus caudatus]